MDPMLVKAILDRFRPEGAPSIDERIDAKAQREIDRRKAMADIGLSEAQAAAYPRGMERAEELHAAQLANYASLDAARSKDKEMAGTVVYDKDGNAYRSVGDKAYPITVADAQSAAATPPPPSVDTVPETGETGSFTQRTEGMPQDTTAAPVGGGGGAVAAGRQLQGKPPGVAATKTYKIDTVDEHGNAVQRIVEGDVGSEWPKGPTAEARNMEIQGAAVDPAFESMLEALDVFEQVMGSDPGPLDRAEALIPGTQAYWARDNFVKMARALAGAIVARQAGEGSRLSDEDRKAYSEAAAVVNSVIVLPGGIAEARRRLIHVRGLLANIQARRKAVASNQQGMSDYGGQPDGGVPETGKGSEELKSPPPLVSHETSVAPGAVETMVVNGVTYEKAPGGWRKKATNAR